MAEETKPEALLSIEAEAEERKTLPVIEKQPRTGLELLKPLLISGAEFLMNLRRTLERPPSATLRPP